MLGNVVTNELYFDILDMSTKGQKATGDQSLLMKLLPKYWKYIQNINSKDHADRDIRMQHTIAAFPPKHTILAEKPLPFSYLTKKHISMGCTFAKPLKLYF